MKNLSVELLFRVKVFFMKILDFLTSGLAMLIAFFHIFTPESALARKMKIAIDFLSKVGTFIEKS